MKIVNIETYLLRADLATPLIWANGKITQRETTIVRIITDEGLEGWGETTNSQAAFIIKHELTPLLIAEDPCNRTRLWQKMMALFSNSNNASGIAMCAMSAIDIALWDIFGKLLKLPIYKLLGGAIRKEVCVYATGFYYTEENSAHQLQKEAEKYMKQGFKGMKMKIGGLTINEDLKRVAALREIIGTDIHLMVDANQAYNAISAYEIGHKMTKFNIFWFEEPVPADSWELYLEIKKKLPIPLAGGENFHSEKEIRNAIACHAFDIIQPNAGNIGGITGINRVGTISYLYGIPLYAHAWGTPILLSATLHFLAALRPLPIAYNTFSYVQEPLLEMDCTPNPVRDELCDEPIIFKDGFLKVSNKYGLGVQPHLKTLQSMSIKK